MATKFKMPDYQPFFLKNRSNSRKSDFNILQTPFVLKIFIFYGKKSAKVVIQNGVLKTIWRRFIKFLPKQINETIFKRILRTFKKPFFDTNWFIR
jgi:hypothetical protein